MYYRKNIWKIIIIFTTLSISSVSAKGSAKLEPLNPEVGFENKSRLQIKITSDNNIDLKKFRIRAVQLCTKKYRHCKKAMKIKNSSHNNPAIGEYLFADVVSDPSEYKYIRLITAKGNRKKWRKHPFLVRKTIRLRKPIKLEKGFTYNLFVDLKLKRNTINWGKIFRPKFKAFSIVGPNPDRIAVVKHNKSQNIKLDGGFSVSIPSGSVSKNTVLSIEIDRDNLSTGSLQILPELKFKKTATVTIKFDPRDREKGEVLDLMNIKLNGERLNAVQLPSDENGLEVFQVEINEGGLLAISDRNDLALQPAQAAKAFSARALDILADTNKALGRSAPNNVQNISNLTGACATKIAPFKSTMFLNSIDTVQYYDTCETIHPKVHIAITDLWSANNTLVYPFKPNTLPLAGNGKYTLRTLTGHVKATGSYAAINGYVWGTSEYYSSGLHIPIFQAGTPEGTQISEGQILTSVPETSDVAEAMLAFTRKNDISGTSAKFIDKPANSSPNLGEYNYNVISSRASIVKNGVCTKSVTDPGITEQASAIGITDNGFFVMMSTSSAQETTRYDLCQVFLALDVNNAILLDGGTSTSMYVGGTLLNPLTSLRYFVAGSQRRVVSAIGIQ